MDNSESGPNEVVGVVNAATDALKNAGVGHDAMQGLAIAAAILGLVFLVLWGMKRFGNSKAEAEPNHHERPADGHDLVALFRDLGAKFDSGMEKVEHRLSEQIGELKSEFGEHARVDRENFVAIFQEQKVQGQQLAHIEGTMDRRATGRVRT